MPGSTMSTSSAFTMTAPLLPVVIDPVPVEKVDAFGDLLELCAGSDPGTGGIDDRASAALRLRQQRIGQNQQREDGDSELSNTHGVVRA